ncbi:unnamed protein product [Caretta caretta]
MTQCYDAVPQHTATFGSSPSPSAPFAPQPRSPGPLSRLPAPRTAPGCSPSAGGAAAGRTDGALGTRFQGDSPFGLVLIWGGPGCAAPPNSSHPETRL